MLWRKLLQGLIHALRTEDIREAAVTPGKANVAQEECDDSDVSFAESPAASETTAAPSEHQPPFTSRHSLQLSIVGNQTQCDRRGASKPADTRSLSEKAARRFATTASTDGNPKPSTSTCPDSVLATPSGPYGPEAVSTQ